MVVKVNLLIDLATSRECYQFHPDLFAFARCCNNKHLIEEMEFVVAGAAEVPRRLSSPLNYLKRFNISLHGLADFSIALCLIRSSPYIQDIEMTARCWRYNLSDKLEASNEVDEVLASFSDVTLNHLRTVQLKGVEGIKLELQLIMLLLTKSPMLVRMLIDPWYDDNYDARRDKIAAATTIQRASSKAHVVVSDMLEYCRDTMQ